jgi:hypothetical protein
MKFVFSYLISLTSEILSWNEQVCCGKRKLIQKFRMKHYSLPMWQQYGTLV